MCFILLGDVGGTNIRLYLIESDYDLKNFHCKLSVNYLQHTTVMIEGEKKIIQTYTNISQPLHDFLAEYSNIFEKNIQNKPEKERDFIMKNPEYNTYTKRSITPEGKIVENEEKYLRFWTKEPIEYKDPHAKLFRLFAAVAIAGNPVNNAIEKLANINWGRTDGNQIKDLFKFGCFYMLNDFHANGYGVLSMKSSKLIMINKNVVKKAQQAIKKQNKTKKKKETSDKKYLSDHQINDKELTLVMGMGTGLGVCGILTKSKNSLNQISEKKNSKKKDKINLYLNPDSSKDSLKTQIEASVFNKNVLVMPSEGGHVGFPFFESEDNFDIEFQNYVKEQKGINFNFVSQELIYCGQGIPFLYQFINLRQKTGNTSKPTGKEIFTMAMNKDPVSMQTFDKFLEYLGISIYTISVMFVNKDRFVLIGTIINSLYHKLYKKERKKFWSLISKRLLAKTKHELT